MRMRIVAMVLLASTAAGAQAQPSTPPGPTLDQAGLQWATWPRLKDMRRHYPMRAQLFGVERGWADVSCTSNARGRLRCSAVQEWPTNRSFGEAAERVMRGARVAATDGGSPEGRAFGYRVRFGYWLPEELDDRWHPVEAGLRWTERPRISEHWNLAESAKDQVYSLPFSCEAGEDGALSCTPGAANAHPKLVKAALESLAVAKVERLNGGSPAGVRFDYTMKVVRTSNCFTGDNRITSEATGPDSSSFSEEDISAGASVISNTASNEGQAGFGGGYRVRGSGGCKPSLLQVR